jgi:hypothetical protein
VVIRGKETNKMEKQSEVSKSTRASNEVSKRE